MNEPITVTDQRHSEPYFKNRQWRVDALLTFSDNLNYEIDEMAVSLDDPQPPPFIGFQLKKEGSTLMISTNQGLKIIGKVPDGYMELLPEIHKFSS